MMNIIENIFLFWRKNYDLFLDLLFPLTCAGCSDILKKSEKTNRLCAPCFKNLIIKRSKTIIKNDIIYSPLDYKDKITRELIHRLKYKFDKGVAIPLAGFLITHLALTHFKEELNKDAVIIPIPLHNKKYKNRGFNQSHLIANLVGERLLIPVLENVLIRVKNTSPQSQIKEIESKELNIKNCFKVINEHQFKDKNIILLDDIWTTGTTMKEASKTLRLAGAKKIIFVTASII